MPRDKLMHIAIGLLAGIFGLGVWLAAVAVGWAPLSGAPAACALASTVAGLAEEGADYLDNRMVPGLHGVEPLDALATAAPGVVTGLAVAQVLAVLGGAA